LAYYDILQRGGKAATVIPLTALYPMVTVLLAVLFLRERLNRIQLGGVFLALSATYLFNVTSEKGLWNSALAIGLLPLVLWGISGFLQKLSTNHLSGPRCALAYFVAFIPVALGIVWREPVDPGRISARLWILVIALGLFLAIGNFALVMAFARGKAAIIAPLTAMYPVVSVPIAILGFDEKVGPRELFGIGLALLASAALAWEPPAPAGNVATPASPA
jgi:drug/metabolite transporter (DMT)-like permease